MTDTIPFSPAQAADDAPTTDRKKLVVGGVVGALVLAAGGYFFLAGGSDSSTPVLIPKKHPVVAAAPAAVVAKAGAKAAPKPVNLPAASTARLGRDPFKALVTVPVAAPPAPATGTGPGTTTTTTTDPTTGTTTTTGTTGTTATAPYSLKLVSISGKDPSSYVYTFSYGTISKKVIAGQKFGKYGELVVLAYVYDKFDRPIGALIQVGDADPKGIAIGSKATVA